MKYRRLIWVTIAIASFIGINTAVVWIILPAERASLQNAYDHIKARAKLGFVRRVHFDSKGGKHRYVVFVPKQGNTKTKLPLLVFLHGISLNGDDGVRHILECLGPPMWDTRNCFPFAILFPQCPVGSTWGADDVAGKLAISLIQKTQEEYDIDPDRIYLTGASSGGAGVWSLAAHYADIFAAVVPISGAVSDEETAKSIANAQLPVWNFYVRGDTEAIEQTNRKMHDLLLKEGASPLSTEIDGVLSDKWWKHDAWDMAYRSPAIHSWLLSQSRRGNSANKGHRFLPIFSRGEDLRAKPATASGWSIDEEGHLSATGAPAKDGPAVLSHDTPFQNYELHFEFRYEQGRRFELSFPSQDGEDIALQLTVPELGSGGVYNVAKQKCLQMSDPAAQRGIFRQIWNDVRIRIEGDRFVVHVNGWKLHDLRDEGFLKRTGVFSLKVPATDTSIQWRNFRIREVKS